MYIFSDNFKFYFIFLNNLIVTTKLVGEFLNVVLLFSYKTFDDNQTKSWNLN